MQRADREIFKYNRKLRFTDPSPESRPPKPGAANQTFGQSATKPNGDHGATTTLSCEAVARAALGEPVGKHGDELYWRCPFRKDVHPSLQVNTRKNKWADFPANKSGESGWSLAAYLAGCDPSDKATVKAWLQERGLLNGTKKRKGKSKDGRGPAVAEFIHKDADGNPVYKKVRHEPGADGREKDYLEWRFEGSGWKPGRGKVIPPLYRLPEIKNKPRVLLFESHTDADRAVKMGMDATTSGGSKSWLDEYAATLAGKDICLIPDNDEPGAKYEAVVCASLSGKAHSLKVVSIAPYHDFRRWADAQGNDDVAVVKLWEMYGAAPEWRPATGAELLQQFEQIFQRYIIAAKGVPLIAGLYAFMTHCFKTFSWIPYLAFSSPLESCGKSQAADIVGWASARPEIVVSITEAGLYRLITNDEPTVVIDEAEILSGDGETAIALRAVLHAGCAPDDTIIRCAPNTHELQRFSPWCPKVFCYIGKLPRVLLSRCIEAGMKRKGSGERVRPFIRHRVKAEVAKLGAEIADWITVHEEEIRRVYESLPDESFGDRARQNFAPLEAILTVANPKRLREFQQVQSGLITVNDASLSDDAIQVRLLLDIKAIFEERKADEIPSSELAEVLAKIETSPWGEWSKGKPLSPAKLARLLKPFQVYPGQIQNGQARGYKLSGFQDSFKRYLPIESVKVSETQYSCGSGPDFKVSNETPSDTLENASSPNNHAGLRHSDTLKPGIEGNKEICGYKQPPGDTVSGVKTEIGSDGVEV